MTSSRETDRACSADYIINTANIARFLVPGDFLHLAHSFTAFDDASD